MTGIFLKIGLLSSLHQTFDYKWLPEENQVAEPGMRVLVEFGKRNVIGIICAVCDETNVDPSRIKTIIEILDKKPLFSSEIMAMILWTSAYYFHALGDVCVSFLPTALRKGKPLLPLEKLPSFIDAESTGKKDIMQLNVAQQSAVDTIIKKFAQFQTYLLYGVTGSGKTEVYLSLIEFALTQKKQVLILVPEIGLTPQIIMRFRERLAGIPIAILHSELTEKKRLAVWCAARSEKISVLIGTRSAVMTPLPSLGLIMIDEEHDLSYKQQSNLRYSARDMALWRAKQLNIPIVLGSATPSIESFYNADKKRYQTLILADRAANAMMPTYHLIDIRQQTLQEGISDTLLNAMQKCLEKDEQVLLFLNRRGFAESLLCHDCGAVANCKQCDAHLTFHKLPNPQLCCHHCGRSYRIPKQCPDCHSERLWLLGMGTERIEQVLQKQFPDIEVIRIDRDTTRGRGSLEDKISQVRDGRKQILVGTQMLAKGHHFPNVTLVGVINMDAGLFSSDFRATERMGQLLMQIAGRAGRAEKPGVVYLQTHHPNHSLLQCLLHEGYTAFAHQLLIQRKQAHWPPYSYVALIHAEAKKTGKALQFLQALMSQNDLQQALKKLNSVYCQGPVPAWMERKAGYSRAQLIVQSHSRAILHEALKMMMAQIKIKKNSGIRIMIDVDPLSFL